MIDRLTIRMYEMGFGDCFLLSFWSGEVARRILIDCGSLSRPKADVARAAKDIVSECTPAEGPPRVELVVCTHRHKDHVSGFDDPIWAGLEVGEVWMPWTEDPTDPVATRIRNRQSNFALALSQAIQPDIALDSMPLAERRRPNLKELDLVLALNSLTNEKAMGTLHRGFSGRPPRYFLPIKGTEGQLRSLPKLPDVRFHILGPSRREEVIALMDPPSGGAYLTPGLPSTSPQEGGACEMGWRVTEAAFRAQRPDSTFSNTDMQALKELADQPDGDLAAAIDGAVNNTSLMMMIEVGDQFLLFPGDAQWGTWDAVLSQPALRSLLERTTMLKVSHHGSHNGTPKDLLEKVIGDHVTSFLSTAPVKQWPNVPRPPLVDALAKKTTLARSDKDGEIRTAPGFTVRAGFFVEWQMEVAGAGLPP
jgi:beta-lactamase superfamily II metal-dependent hydrolase